MKKILIVEDEQSFLELLSSQLTDKGYNVIEATNGKEGLEKYHKHLPDLILLDIKMPIMGGLEMLDLLRQTKRGKKTKVALLTNFEPDAQIIKNVIHNYPLYFLIKSNTELQDLYKKIEEWLIER